MRAGIADEAANVAPSPPCVFNGAFCAEIGPPTDPRSQTTAQGFNSERLPAIHSFHSTHKDTMLAQPSVMLRPRMIETPIAAFPYFFLCQAIDRAVMRVIVYAKNEKEASETLRELPPKQRTKIFRISPIEFENEPVTAIFGKLNMSRITTVTP